MTPLDIFFVSCWVIAIVVLFVAIHDAHKEG